MGQIAKTDGTKVLVAVSASMARLRALQGVFNGFWQTTELSYGHLLADAETRFPDLSRSTFDELGHVESEVWYPNRQGRIKREVSIGKTLEQVRENTVHVYRATLLSFYTAFESFLDAEVSDLKASGASSWVEFVRSLSGPKLRLGVEPLPLEVVLCADFCRLIRNKLAHGDFDVPRSLSDPRVAKWQKSLAECAKEFGWPKRDVDPAAAEAAKKVIDNAERRVDEAKQQGKELPIELFYMLFTFTNLNNLAFAIEEAIRPLGSDPGSHIYQLRNTVRREDLILPKG